MASVKKIGKRQKKLLLLLKWRWCGWSLTISPLSDREQWPPSQMDWPWTSLLEELSCIVFLKKWMHQWNKNCATPVWQYMCTNIYFVQSLPIPRHMYIHNWSALCTYVHLFVLPPLTSPLSYSPEYFSPLPEHAHMYVRMCGCVLVCTCVRVHVCAWSVDIH